MITKSQISLLEEKGYLVIHGILTDKECDKCIGKFQDWLKQFTDDGTWPFSMQSLIQRYRVGFTEPAWFARLRTKDVFADIWGTDKLLTSLGSVAIGRPAETTEETFWDANNPGWLHFDQGGNKTGLHCYQGAVYLEEASENDWTFEVLEGSHKFHEEFFSTNQKAYIRSSLNNFYRLKDDDKLLFEEKKFKKVRVPVPKGGMVLWDSRLVHANARPKRDREDARWRYVVMNCMVPAIWARKEDLMLKKLAYANMVATAHWPAHGVALMSTHIPSDSPKEMVDFDMPGIGCSDTAKKLCGILPYDFNDGKANGPSWSPVFKTDVSSSHSSKKFYHALRSPGSFRIMLGVVVIALAVSWSAFALLAIHYFP